MGDEKRLKEIETKMAVTTPGPWHRPAHYAEVWAGPERTIRLMAGSNTHTEPSAEDCDFVASIRSEAPWLISELRKAWAIVDRLPKTADGVLATPGMTVWPRQHIEGEEGAEIRLFIYDTAAGELLFHGDTADVGKCYSTREAADAARANLKEKQ